jgi:putative membrane protein
MLLKEQQNFMTFYKRWHVPIKPTRNDYESNCCSISSPRQKFMATCRVGFTHHSEPIINDLSLQMTPLWCVQRTLQILFQRLSFIESMSLKILRLLSLLLIFMLNTVAEAHGLENTSWQWSLTGFILVSVVVFSFLLSRFLKRRGATRALWRGQVLTFALALATLALALLSPLATWAHHSFAIHMTQHMLLILGAAVLLAYSAPGWMVLWVLPLRLRQHLRPLWRWLGNTLRVLSKPLFVWLIFGAVIWLWHVPSFYNWALENSVAHGLEHTTMLGSALLFWWLVVQPLGRKRLTPGAAILYLFTTLLHTGLLGALLTFASEPLYTHSPLLWNNFSSLQDQQLAGLIMWAPMGLILGAWTIALLGQWLRSMEERLPG